jgi:hypothetical protein
MVPGSEVQRFKVEMQRQVQGSGFRGSRLKGNDRFKVPRSRFKVEK